jgi:hypothetical protein
LLEFPRAAVDGSHLREIRRRPPAALAGDGRPYLRLDQPVVQACPLTVYAVGEALLVVQVPWTPKEVEAAAATAPL